MPRAASVSAKVSGVANMRAPARPHRQELGVCAPLEASDADHALAWLETARTVAAFINGCTKRSSGIQRGCRGTRRPRT